MTDLFTAAIRKMENVNVGSYLFQTGTAEPGLDNYESKFRDALKRMEQTNV
jgi:hypothetical protein